MRALRSLLPLVLAAACATDAATSTGDTAQPTGDTAQPTDDVGTPGDTADPGDDVGLPDDPGPWDWPLPQAPVTVPADAAWRDHLDLPWDPFVTAAASDGANRWVKFTVLLRDPTRVYFQDSTVYPFHHPFAAAKLPPFQGLDATAFDAVTLRESGQEAVLGAVLLPADYGVHEFGIQLVGHDAYHPELVRRVVELVRSAITTDDTAGGGGIGIFADDGAAEVPVRPQWPSFYMPTYEQAASATHWAPWLAQRGVEVSSTARWAQGDQCYAGGWALGRLVQVPGDQLTAAYADGRLTERDILLTDGVPAEIPYVAGVLSLSPSTPSSHVAILSTTYGVPFVHLALDATRADALALVDRPVYVRTEAIGGTTQCRVAVVSAEAIPEADREALAALGRPTPLEHPPKAHAGVALAHTDDLAPADATRYGGKAANFGILRDAIPDASPDAWAIPFDLWDAVMAAPTTVDGETRPLSQHIAARLAPFAYPVTDLGGLYAALADVRALIEDHGVVPAAEWTALAEALQEAFDPAVRLRFRSSTNIEDGESFTGAGLYSSNTGCLADDLDADDEGPSACQPDRAKERSARGAILESFASFYNDNAYLERLRRGVDEADAGMAVLVHPSFPDETELANGVATVAKPSEYAEITLVSQVGATSITNPDTTALPEVLRISVWPSFRSTTQVQASTLVTLGDTVFGVAFGVAAGGAESPKNALVDLLLAVHARWAEVRPEAANATLDLEYKVVATAKGPAFVVKQVRPLPKPSDSKVPAYVMPTSLELCTFQGENGSPLGTHRSKMRWQLQLDGRTLDASGLATPLATARVELPVDDAVATFEDALKDAAHTSEPSEWAPGTTTLVDAATVGGRALRLRTTLATERTLTQGPLVLPSDLTFEVESTWDTPQPTGNDWEPTTTVDYARLEACPSAPEQPERTVTGGDGGVTVTVRMKYPEAPGGISAGYTAPLGEWVETRIEGLTDAPIVLTDWWAQTFRPEHHNFSEWFVFEPRLQPDLPEATRTALDARGIRALVLRVGDAPYLKALDATGALVDVPK